MPISRIFSIYCAAEPSRIGNSGPLTCMRQLSIPNAYRAARPCSTVEILTSPLPKTVPRCVSTTFSAMASIMGWPSRSILCILYPVFSLAGLNVIVRFNPV